jgi:hypothetical protein
VDEMTVERVDDLVRYWAEFPPAHLLVRAAIGFEPKKREPRESRAKGSASDVAELARAFGGQVVSRGR